MTQPQPRFRRPTGARQATCVVLVVFLFVLGADVAGAQPSPFLVTDIATTPAASNPSGFVRFGANTYFVASTPTTGTEVWMTDGTPAGTRHTPRPAATSAQAV